METLFRMSINIPLGIHAVIEYVKKKRREGSHANNLETGKQIPNEFLQSHLAKLMQKSNPPIADVDYLYPIDKYQDQVWEDPTKLAINQNVKSNFEREQRFLDDLVPLVYPADSYFEDVELECLEKKSSLAFPPRNYISLSTVAVDFDFFLEQHWRHNYNYVKAINKQGRIKQLSNRYVITVLNDRPLAPLIEKLVENISGLLRIYVDAYFIGKSLITEGEKTRERYELFYPEIWSAVNTTEYIYNRAELQQLLREIEPESFVRRLNEKTLMRREVFGESNVSLHRILAFQICIQSLPASILYK